MILEFRLDYRSSSGVYEKIFARVLKKHSLEGRINKDGYALKLYAEADSGDKLEEFSSDFSRELPHSIFLYSLKAELVEEIPSAKHEIQSGGQKLSLPFCPKCMREATDPSHENYYNIHTQCEVCGYGTYGKSENAKEQFEKFSRLVKSGKRIKVRTFYGEYTIALPDVMTKLDADCDLLVYDLATAEKYAFVEQCDLAALAAFEKPYVRLRTKTRFEKDYGKTEKRLARFKLADDFILYFLMRELHEIGIDMVGFSSDADEYYDELILISSYRVEVPIEVTASSKNVVIVEGEKGLPRFPAVSSKVVPAAGSFFSVIKEHRLSDENIAGIYLSREHGSAVQVYGRKYGLIEYLGMDFSFTSVRDIFERISSLGESGEKIINNYKRSFPQLCKRIDGIIFERKKHNLYEMWGAAAILLGISDTNDLQEAAAAMEKEALSFLGAKGPRIDYKTENIAGRTSIDPLATFRTAMSFRLAGVDSRELCYGIAESFAEFLSNELDVVRQNMDITAVALSGSLLGNKQFFSKLDREISADHSVYYNVELPIAGRNMFYGGMSLEDGRE